MSEFIQLQTWGEQGQCDLENKSVPVLVASSWKSHVFVVYTFILMLILSFGFTSFLFIHSQKEAPNLNVIHEELAEIKLAQLSNDLEEEYAKMMNEDISDTSSLNLDKLQEFHNSTKTLIMQTFKEAAEGQQKTLQASGNQLSSKLDSLFNAIKQDQVFKMETKIAEASHMATLMTQKLVQNLEEKLFQNNTNEDLEQFQLSEQQRILEEFENATIHGEVFENLKSELENELEKVFANLGNLTFLREVKLIEAKKLVEKVYHEEFMAKVSQQEREAVIPQEISFEFHEKVCEIVLSKCIQQNLFHFAPNSKVLLELRQFLDQLYDQKVRDHAVIGIDFGNKYARAAVYFQGQIQIIPHFDQSGEVYNSTACYVGIEKYDGWVGQCAQNLVQSSTEALPIVYDMKEIILGWTNSTLQRKPEQNSWTFTATAENTKSSPTPMVSGKDFHHSVTLILSKLFRKIRENSEQFLESSLNVENCVITVNYDFDQVRKDVIILAAEMAGFQKVTILEDYAAAGFAYQLQNAGGNWTIPNKLLYIDFGNKWWQFYVLEGAQAVYERVATSYYSGGFTVHANLVNFCIEQFCEEESVSQQEIVGDESAPNTKIRMRRLSESCGKAITSLSTEQAATILIPNFHGGKTLSVNITRTKFEELNAAQFNKISEVIEGLLSKAKLKKENNFEIIVAGDRSGIPKVKEIVENFFNGKNVYISSIQPEHVVAYGAAVKGAILAAKAIKDKS